MIAYLGTGLLGTGFVKAMLLKGTQVQVWNRTAEKAKALEADGAVAFDKIVDAVKGVSRIHLTLKDDVSVNKVLNAASVGFEPGVVIVDHTTTSVEGAKERTEKWKEKGFTYIHAPVFMGPPNALESTGYMLVSGEQDAIAAVLPELEKMTGKVINFGAETGKAAGIKLLGNLFLIAFTAGISDMLALSKALGIPASDISALFNEWNPGAMLPARLKRMTAGTFDKPSWELDMARKDAGLMMNEAQQAGIPLVVLPAIAAEMDRWIADGHGKSDWTVIAKDNL
ncbi:MAG: NAD(P)-dependent oxidoreductase [Taibaiella sp.]|nr:NAD(P)-dependent oxidoreductase [Taibaiella sp.]